MLGGVSLQCRAPLDTFFLGAAVGAALTPRHRHSCLAVATRTGFRILNTQVCNFSRVLPTWGPWRSAVTRGVKGSLPLFLTRPARSLVTPQTGDCVYEEQVGAVRCARSVKRLHFRFQAS
jgi:hypothetical protein